MSMSRHQFDLQINRLCDTFDDKYFGEQRVYMIWEMAKDLDYEQFISVVDQFIRSSKHAPLPSDFGEAIKGFETKKTTYLLGEMQPEEIAQCHDCADSGFIRLVRKETFEPWAKWPKGSAPCHCNRGGLLVSAAKRNRRVDLGPLFCDAWRASYDVITPYPKTSEMPP